jgi:CelD/BcsL family acetyltransferase involved in cellulose biosynthesis
MFSITELHTLDELLAIEDEWRRLYDECPWGTPFQSPDWLMPWWRHFGIGALRVIAVRDGARLVCLAPFRLDTHSRLLSMLGTGISDYLDILCAAGAADAAGAVLAHLASQPEQWAICDLQELRPESPLFSARVPEGLSSVVEQMGVCPVIELPPTEAEYLAGRRYQIRRSLKRAEALLRIRGEFAIEQVSGREVGNYVEILFELHRKRWELRDAPGVLDTPALRDFHREVSRRMFDSGALQLNVLWSNRSPAAAFYGFRKAQRLYAYLSGFDPALSRSSPGSVLLWAVIRQAIGNGIREFDMLRGGEAYKYDWGARDSWNYRMVLKPLERRDLAPELSVTRGGADE